ncbi:MAG: hypothetical protein D4Q78_01390 [Streptomycetaceae bacterium]|nr:MAG: hypothetical protein D4Q78_01390 [Streptomycetaceae bacterium]
MNRRVDIFMKTAKSWQEEFALLRQLAIESGLTEDLKWGHPCYTLENGNVFLIHGFKNYCAIAFFKGALMKDLQGILIQQTENVQSGRQIRFTSLAEIKKMKKTIKSYMAEAIAIEKAGLKVEFTKTVELVIPLEVERLLKKVPGLAVAFKKLTPGRKRAYVLHFAAAKQVKTMEARIERCAPLIMKGKGLNEY